MDNLSDNEALTEEVLYATATSQTEMVEDTLESITVTVTPQGSAIVVLPTASSTPLPTSTASVSETPPISPTASFQVQYMFDFGRERNDGSWRDRIRVSPDGVWLAFVRTRQDKQDLLLVNYVTGEQRVLYTTESIYLESLSRMRFSPDSQLLAVAGRGEVVWVWDVFSGELGSQLSIPGWVSDLAFSNDGRLLAVSSASENPQDFGVRVFDIESQQLVVETRDSVATSVSFLENGQQLVVGAEYYSNQFMGSTLYIWNYETDEVEPILSQQSLTQLVTVNDDTSLLLAMTENILHLFELPSLREIKLEESVFSARTIQFDERGNIWALAFDGTLSQWRVDGTLVRQRYFPEATDFAVLPEINHLLIVFPEEIWEVVFP